MRSERQKLIDNLRDLHAAYRDDRPDDVLRRCEALKADIERADRQAHDAVARQKAITQERAQFRDNAVRAFERRQVAGMADHREG